MPLVSLSIAGSFSSTSVEQPLKAKAKYKERTKSSSRTYVHNGVARRNTETVDVSKASNNTVVVEVGENHEITLG